MKIYTKTGDSGTTALIGGTRVSKDSLRVEAYGTVDELIAWLGVVRSFQSDGNSTHAAMLLQIQKHLMACAALLAADETTAQKLPAVPDEAICQLEKAIDDMQQNLPQLKTFVVPAAPTVAAMCHVARTVCRRAERCAVRISHEPQPCKELAQQSQNTLDKKALIYLNRLSDFLFTLSRQLTIDSGLPEDCW